MEHASLNPLKNSAFNDWPLSSSFMTAAAAAAAAAATTIAQPSSIDVQRAATLIGHLNGNVTVTPSTSSMTMTSLNWANFLAAYQPNLINHFLSNARNAAAAAAASAAAAAAATFTTSPTTTTSTQQQQQQHYDVNGGGVQRNFSAPINPLWNPYMQWMNGSGNPSANAYASATTAAAMLNSSLLASRLNSLATTNPLATTVDTSKLDVDNIGSSYEKIESCIEILKKMNNGHATPIQNGSNNLEVHCQRLTQSPINVVQQQNGAAVIASPSTPGLSRGGGGLLVDNASATSNLATLAEIACRFSPEQTTTGQQIINGGCCITPPSLNKNGYHTPVENDINSASMSAWAALTSRLLAAAEMQESASLPKSTATTTNSVTKENFKNQILSSTTTNTTSSSSSSSSCTNSTNTIATECNSSEMPCQFQQSKNAGRRNCKRKSNGRNVSERKNRPNSDSIDDAIDSVIRFNSGYRCQSNEPASNANNDNYGSSNFNIERPKSLSAQIIPVVSSSRCNLGSFEHPNYALDLTVKRKKSNDYTSDNSDTLCTTQASSLGSHDAASTSGVCHRQPASTNVICSDSSNLQTPVVSLSQNVNKSIVSTTNVSQVGCKRSVVDMRLIREPLLRGWRRQTCLRAISASGPRGDVLYYAPFGRKFASTAEIARYLKKQPDNALSIDCFTFSSKVTVGEYLYATPSGIKNISESEVIDMIVRMRNTNGLLKGSGKKLPLDLKKSTDQEANACLVDNFQDAISTSTTVNCRGDDDDDDDDDADLENAVALCIIDLVNLVDNSLNGR